MYRVCEPTRTPDRQRTAAARPGWNRRCPSGPASCCRPGTQQRSHESAVLSVTAACPRPAEGDGVISLSQTTKLLASTRSKTSLCYCTSRRAKTSSLVCVWHQRSRELLSREIRQKLLRNELRTVSDFFRGPRHKENAHYSALQNVLACAQVARAELLQTHPP